jgi:hypothetical protein
MSGIGDNARPCFPSGKRNFLLNPEHPQFRQIDFLGPFPFPLRHSVAEASAWPDHQY